MIRRLSLRKSLSCCDAGGLLGNSHISLNSFIGRRTFIFTSAAMSEIDVNAMSKNQIELRISELNNLIATHKINGDHTLTKTQRKKQNRQVAEKTRLEKLLPALIPPPQHLRK